MKVLTNLQKRVLQEIAKSALGKRYVWTGGTALAYRLQHRYSEDLDFFSDKEEAPEIFISEINKLSEKLDLKKISYQEKLNRRLFIFSKGSDKLQLEFVYFPFKPLEEPQADPELDIKIAGLKDIAVNKTLSAFQRQEPKDAYDLYILLKDKKFKLTELVKAVRIKFDVHIDNASLLAKIIESVDNLDKIKPLFIKKESGLANKIKNFFQKQGNDYLKSLLF